MGQAVFVVAVTAIFLIWTVEASPAAVIAEPAEETISTEGAECRVKLFGNGNYGGLKLIVTEATKDLGTSDFNDKASSAWVIGPCAWIFYVDYYNGDPCILHTGKYPTTYYWGQSDNVVSSLRPIPKSGTNVIVLYEHWYAGKELVLKNSDNNIHDDAFGDITTTIIVTGGTWEVFEHPEFGGRSVTLKPGYYTTPGGNDYISSVKKLK